jgi:hypothetical protein
MCIYIDQYRTNTFQFRGALLKMTIFTNFVTSDKREFLSKFRLHIDYVDDYRSLLTTVKTWQIIMN